jgi:hypothetical protein
MMSRRLIGGKSLIWTVVRKWPARYPKLGALGRAGAIFFAPADLSQSFGHLGVIGTNADDIEPRQGKVSG